MEQKRFGRYVVLGELGRGAMGMVYRAVDPLIEREVAVKTLLPNLPEDIMVEYRERFLREARSAGRLNHPNIVTIYDIGEQDGTAYIAMELLDGRTLQQTLRDPERMPFAKSADIIAQVADALDHAQSFGIVHRDVKPANIVVSASGRAKLADFGIARIPSSSMTQTGASLGSPKYMSPEQVLGQPVDARCDIFSLGVVLYEMLIGRTPFERPGETTVFAMMNRLAGEAHVPAHQVDPSVPDAFDRVLESALAKSPAERYARAGEMANDLRNLHNPGAVVGAAAAPGRTPARPRGPRADQSEADKTMRLPPSRAQPPAAAPPEAQKAATELIADLDAFSGAFEEIERASRLAEEQERERKQQSLRQWGEEEERRREEFERQRDATAHGATSAMRRGSAFEKLRQRATRNAEDEKANHAANAASIDRRLRDAFRFLSELAVALNAAHPAAERPCAGMFFGDIRAAILSDGFTSSRTRSLDGKEVFDFVTFMYRLRSPRPLKVEVIVRELPRVREQLNAARVPHQVAEETNLQGQLTRATLTTSGPFPCQAVLRGDYDNAGFVIELENVRRNGTGRVLLGVDELNDEVLDEFSTYVLGIDDRFERFLKRR